jgi:hypothetical protein
MNKFSSPFMAKSPLPKKKLEEKVEMARRAAFIRSKSESEDYEESKEEKRAQRKYKRLSERLDRKRKKEQK